MKTDENKTEILKAFDTYRNIVFATDTDLNFWKSFLDTSINDYKMNNPNQVELYEAGFYVYDYGINNDYGFLKGHKESRSIDTSNIERYKDNFISWVSNLAILKVYNALENFMLRAIQIKYFPTLNFNGSRKGNNEINNAIISYLKFENINIDTKNNRHIIQFLRNKSSNITLFLDHPMNIDVVSSWGNFFELISILRNIVAHQGTIVSHDSHNEIKSIAKDIFNRHFSIIKDELGAQHLQPNNNNGEYSHLISLFNSFALHIVQCIFDENDLKFLGMN